MDFNELNKKMNEISLELDPSYQSGVVKGSPPPIPKPYMQKQIYAKYPRGSKVDKATMNQIIKMYKNAGLDPLDAPVGHVQPDADGMYVIEHQCNEAEVTLKAHGGDRAINLEGIADEIGNQIKNINRWIDNNKYWRQGSIAQYLHKLKGYAEQLRIIADELRSGE